MEDPENVRSCFMSYDVNVGIYGVRHDTRAVFV